MLKEKIVDSEKNKKILAINRKLKRNFTNMPPKTKKIVEELIENVAFMIYTLDQLQESITEVGTTTEYKNGENQYGTRVNPDIQTYNSMFKNYASAIKQLTDLMPKEEAKATKDELMDFINAR